MRYCLFIFFSLFFVSYCAAQDTLARRERLSDTVTAHYHVLRSAPDVKVGLYTALLHRRWLIARGNYNNGKKVGIWQFFDTMGRLNEKYNYDKKIFTYEALLYASRDFSFLFDDSIKMSDKLTRPLKVGGIYYGFLPYLNIFTVPFDTEDINTSFFNIYIELLISPLGRLADYKIRVVSDDYNYDQIFNIDVHLFSDEDRTFTPATLNGTPVMSRILIRCILTPNGGLDFY